MAARKKHRLSARTVASKRKPGRYGDQEVPGLYLQVSESGAKSYLFRYMLRGRARAMGLGATNTFSLKQARERAQLQRQLLADGIDPLGHRDDQTAAAALDRARSKTFKECADSYIAEHRHEWRNAKHVDQWNNTITTYGESLLALPVQAIDTSAVLRVLQPIWNEKRETATRLRGRIEKVLDSAKTLGFRSGDNPARWRGHLDTLLAKDHKRKRVRHHPALPFSEIGKFMRDLRAQEGVAARCLEFTILTAARTGEAIGARWSEIDLEAAIWTVPPARTKTHRELRVPLSPDAVSLLRALPRAGDCVFPGQRPKRPLSNMSMLKLLARMGRDEITVHGMRSTFRDWAAERTNFPNHVVEMCLAHAVGDVEGAYRRGDLIEQRRLVMDAWSSHTSMAGSAKVIDVKRVA